MAVSCPFGGRIHDFTFLHLTQITDLTSGTDTSRSRAIFLWFTSRCSVSVNADASGCILMGRSGDALEATT